MIREIQADQLALPIEHLASVHIVDVWQCDGFGYTGCRTEETHLPGFGCAGMVAAYGDHTIDRSQQSHPIAKGIQRANLDQALQAALADRAQVHPAG